MLIDPKFSITQQNAYILKLSKSRTMQKKTFSRGWKVVDLREQEILNIMVKAESSHSPIFKSLPTYHEDCGTYEERTLHLARAALRLKERYSHKPFYAQRAAKHGASYWIGLAYSAVNA